MDIMDLASQHHADHLDKFVLVNGISDEGCYSYRTLTLSDSLDAFLKDRPEGHAYWNKISNVQYEEDGAHEGSVFWMETESDPAMVKEYDTYACDGRFVVVYGYCTELQKRLQKVYDEEQSIRDGDHPRTSIDFCQRETIHKRKVRLARELQMSQSHVQNEQSDVVDPPSNKRMRSSE